MDGVSIEAWIATRPTAIQVLAKEYPPGSAFDFAGVRYYLIGYGEAEKETENMLIVSQIDPAADYEGAIEAREYIHVRHLVKGDS